MKVTYLILTWNRKEVLRRHLKMILGQTYPGPFEVIVCVDGSTDGTQDMLQDLEDLGWPQKFTLKWFDTGNTDKNTAAQARNIGIKEATGKMIVMVDDDNMPHNQLIESYVNAFSLQEIQLGYKSNFEIYLDMNFPVPIEDGLMKTWADDWQAGKFGHFQTGNCAMSIEAARTPAKDGSIGFDERFIGYGHEDTEFGRRLAAGYKLVFNPDAVTWHMHPGASPQQDPELKAAERIASKARLDQIMGESA